MIKLHYSLFFILFLCGCYSINEQNSQEYYNVTHYDTQEKIQNAELRLDTIKIDSTIEWSYAGYFWLRNDTLCLSDLYFGYIYRINTDGSVIDQQVGFGRGADEAISFTYSIPMDRNFALVSTGWMIYQFNTLGKKQNEVRLKWAVTPKEIQKFSSKAYPANYLSYENDFPYPDVVGLWSDQEMAIGMTASLPLFNGYFNTDVYYNYSRIIAIADMHSGKINRIIGRRSPLYLEYKNLPNFDHFCFTVLPETVLLNFNIDPKIYVIDKNKDKALYSFGVPGRDMNTRWPLTQSYEDAENQLQNDRYVYGYYSYLKYDATRDLTFRGYRKGAHADTDGLQVYKGKTLIADIDVPQGFKVIGSLNDNFYAQISNESEIPCFYRFSITNLK